MKHRQFYHRIQDMRLREEIRCGKDGYHKEIHEGKVKLCELIRSKTRKQIKMKSAVRSKPQTVVFTSGVRLFNRS